MVTAILHARTSIQDKKNKLKGLVFLFMTP